MKTYKEFISEEKITIGKRSIKVEKPHRARGDVLVNVKTSAFDKAWKKSEMYIGKKGTGSIKGRYERFGLFIKGGSEDIGDGIEIDYEPADSMEVSEVYVTDKGEIQFTNGRHRFAWLRDQGLKKIPVVMPKESIINAKKFKLI